MKFNRSNFQGGKISRKIYIISALAVVLVLLVSGVAVDFLSFDRTKGGYEPPYTGYTGEPVNWNEGRITEIGFYRDGYVVNTIFNCTSGEISFNLIGIDIPFRKVSERGIVVHKPREACTERGFKPEF